VSAATRRSIPASYPRRVRRRFIFGTHASPAGLCTDICGKAVRYAAAVSQLSRAALDELVAEAVVDAYNDDEQLTGLYTMIEEHLAVPFETTLFGVEVTVRRVDLQAEGIVAICHRGRDRQASVILDLPLPDPAPEGARWIAAYRHWAGR
jgi:calcium binding protein